MAVNLSHQCRGFIMMLSKPLSPEAAASENAVMPEIASLVICLLAGPTTENWLLLGATNWTTAVLHYMLSLDVQSKVKNLVNPAHIRHAHTHPHAMTLTQNKTDC